jgi:hypothetical protein
MQEAITLHIHRFETLNPKNLKVVKHGENPSGMVFIPSVMKIVYFVFIIFGSDDLHSSRQ